MNTSKSNYRKLCEKEESISIFSSDWWLDAVAGEENWDVVMVEKGGEVIATLPYVFRKNENGLNIYMPKLTQTMGIWIKYPEGQKYSTRLHYEKVIFTELINKLPDFNKFVQKFHYSFTNWLPFYWKGFQQTTRYTYVIQKLNDIEYVYKNFESDVRSDIRKAEKLVRTYDNVNIENFYEINLKTFKRKNIEIPYSLEFVKSLDEACDKRKCRKIFFAEDEKKRIHAAVYIVWDKNSAYYLMGGVDPEFNDSSSTSLLIWEAIKFASKVTKRFDFEGSMVESIEKFFRSFGAIQKPYFQITKTNEKYKDVQRNYKVSVIKRGIRKIKRIFK